MFHDLIYKESLADRDLFSTSHLRADLGRRSVRGGAVVFAGRLATLALHVTATVSLARLLAPDAFGLVAVAMIIADLLFRVVEGGLRAPTVQRETISHAEVSTLFWINVLLGVVCAAALAALGPVLVGLYGRPELFWIAPAFSVTVLLWSLSIQHSALLQRQMQFRRLVSVEVLSALLSVAAAIAAALLGAGYWALIVQRIATRLVNTAGMWIALPWIPGRPQRSASLRGMLSFGGHLTLAELVAMLCGRLDRLVVGGITGAANLGLYDRASSVLSLSTYVGVPMSAVTTSGLSRLHVQEERFREYFRGALLATAFTMVPIPALMIAAPEDILVALFGSQWTGAAPVLQVLALAGFLDTFTAALYWVFFSSGRADRQLRWGVVNLAGLLLGLAAGAPFGMLGVAIGVAATRLLLFYPTLAYGVRGSALQAADALSVLWRSLLACAAGIVAARAAGALIALPGPGLAALVAKLAAFGIAYLFSWALLPGGGALIRIVVNLSQDLIGARLTAVRRWRVEP